MPTELPKNEFLWSHTRYSTFQQCLRRYYFAFYAAWAGWLPGIDPKTREIYILKRLYPRADWVSLHITIAIAQLLRSVPRPATPEAIKEAAATIQAKQIEFMRTEFLHSRSGAFRADPVHMLGLYEHTFPVPVSPAEWKATVDRLPLAIQTFAASSLAVDLFQKPREKLILIDRPITTLLNNFKVRAHPHLLLLENRRIHLYQWEAHPDVALPSLRQRLAIHACLAAARNGEASPPLADPSLPIRATAYSPIFDQSLDFDFSPEEIQNTREFIIDSADEMLFPLADPSTNDPGDGTTFDPSPSPSLCPSCPFHLLCPSALH